MLVFLLLLPSLLPAFLLYCTSKKDHSIHSSRRNSSASSKEKKGPATAKSTTHLKKAQSLKLTQTKENKKKSNANERPAVKVVEKLPNNVNTAKEIGKKPKKTLEIDPTPVSPDARSNYQSDYGGAVSCMQKEPNEFEKAAFADGVVLDLAKVIRMGNIDKIEEERNQEMCGKDMDLSGKKMVHSEVTDPKTKVKIMDDRCLLYETPDVHERSTKKPMMS